jgi:mono/diheme cytochrome c family protein
MKEFAVILGLGLVWFTGAIVPETDAAETLAAEKDVAQARVAEAKRLFTNVDKPDINEKVYQDNCASCHGDILEGTGLGPALLTEPLVNGNDLDDIIGSITQGNIEKGMPAWKGRMPDSQIRRLAMLILERQAGFKYDDFGGHGKAIDIDDSKVYCVFQTKPATDSRRSLPPIPRECCH